VSNFRSPIRFRIVLSLLLAITLSSHALGRLYETTDELVARYGNPTAKIPQAGSDLVRYEFNLKGFKVTAQVRNNRAYSIAYFKPDGSRLAPEEAAVFLAANANGHKWVEYDVEYPASVGSPKRYERDDGLAVAYCALGTMLIVQAPQLYNGIVGKMVHQKLQEMKGF
jgi:hypothetical protein